MRKSALVLLTLGAAVFLLSNFTTEKQSSFVMTTVNGGPDLPVFPLAYTDIDIPDHLLNPQDTVQLGYETTGPIDTNKLRSINDDIATLGRVLFYDEKLSALDNISCGSCHDQALSFTENKAFSEGILADTKRNSMQLNDLGWTNKENFAWDMRAGTLHEMIKLPLTDENEIGANMIEVGIKLSSSEYYPQLFENAFGDTEINEDRIVEALVQFINSMVTFDSKFDNHMENASSDMTQAELRGLDLFSANCTTCHSQGAHMFGFDDVSSEELLEFFPFFFSNGLAVEAEDLGAGEWNEQFTGLFKVPTLRNIELTAPYMHDGRFTTLDEVIDHYSDDVVLDMDNPNTSFFLPDGGFNFSNQEKADLKSFMQTLTDDTFLTNEKWSNPFASTSIDEVNYFEDLVLKPNPMSDRALIQFSNPDRNMVAINILSNDGRLMKRDNTNDDQYVLEKDLFESGMYYVQLIMDDKKSTQKLIVQ